MIKKILEKFISKFSSKILSPNFVGKSSVLLLLFALVASCTDQGCIEADDFGEYQTETITVTSNASENSCSYNSTLSLTDTSQGNGLKDCLTKGASSTQDENGTIQMTSLGGCSGNQVNSSGTDLGVKLDASFLNLCVQSCIQNCLNGSSAAANSISSSEPNWKSTNARDSSQNFGVEILPGSQISITATGTVTLGGSATYPNLYLPVNSLLNGTVTNGLQPNYQNNNWTSASVFDVKQGQTMTMNFSGAFTRPYAAGSYLYSNATVGAGASTPGSSAITNANIYNGARTLVAYTIPQPDGYVFDNSQSTELAGIKGVPLLPEPASWQCVYNGASSNLNDVTCSNKLGAYSTLGYDASVDTAINTEIPNISSPFFISSTGVSPGIGTYGGPIRWSTDNLINNATDPWAISTNNNMTAITNGYQIPDGLTGATPYLQNIAIPAGGTIIQNGDDVSSYMMSVATSDSACYNGGTSLLTVTLKDANGTVVKGNAAIPLLNSWDSIKYQSRLTVGPGYSLTISAPSICQNKNALSFKFSRFLEIPINRSGFVRFTTLGASTGSNGTCTLNGRIINPSNNLSDSAFYEYNDFDASPSTDPLNILSVPGSASGSTLNWSNSVFVRKGQVLRFSPLSWNPPSGLSGFMTSNGVNRMCGLGMVMQITPRPALLCKGHANESVTTLNPACVTSFNTDGSVKGCQPIASECSDSSSSSYCYSASCLSPLTCTQIITGGVAQPQSTCTPSTNSLGGSSGCDKSKCDSCFLKMVANGGLPATNSLDLDQCYDLENYSGRVSDIPVANGAVVSSSDAMFTKGALKLAPFNGAYGNLEQFSDSKTTDSKGSRIYQTTLPIIFSTNARLRFMTLTNNNNFVDLYSNYTTSSSGATPQAYSTLSNSASPYSGNNGFLLSFSGPLQFSNGQWLEAMLCREDSTNSCNAITIQPGTTGTYFNALNAQPHLVEISNPTTTSGINPILQSTSNYYFNAYGSLIRSTPSGAKDCTAGAKDYTDSGQGVNTQEGSDFYCHTYLDSNKTYIYNASASTPFSNDDYIELDKLRLSFKIKDPEIPNCSTISPSSTDPSTFDGIKQTNPGYQINCKLSGSSVNNGYLNASNTCVSSASITGAMCGTNEIPAASVSSNQTKCYKQFYCASKYSNNSGSYDVTVKVSNPPGSNISNIISSVITPIIQVMDGVQTVNSDGTVSRTVGQSERIYSAIVLDSRYQAILSVCLVAMFTFYGLTYLMGITELSSSDLINRGIKISLIYFFASPGGWYWFNLIVVNWFKNGTDFLAFTMASSFDDSTALKQAIANGYYYDKSVLFSSVDSVFGMFFSQAVQKKISALLFASIFGWLYLFIIYTSFMLYVYSVANAVLYYLTAQIFISILFTLGPLFFIFTLFNQTKGMFDSWLNQIIGFSLQQIFLLTTLAFFNMMMYEVLKMSLGYKICWDEVWSINIITRVSLLSFWTIASLPPRLNTQLDVGNIGHPDGIPSLFSILFIWVIASLMNEFITFMTDLGATIGGSVKASGMASGIKAVTDGMHKFTTDNFEKMKGKAWERTGDKLDKALFNSGSAAKTERAAKRAANTKMQSQKESLNRAGNQAMSDYKKNNVDGFDNIKDKKERERILKDVDNKAREEMAKKLGLSSDDLKKLNADKGLKYEGSNIAIAGAQLARQKLGFGGGFKSNDEKKIDTGLTFGEAKVAMNNGSPEEKARFQENAKENFKIDQSIFSKAYDGVTGGTKQLATDVALATGVGAVVSGTMAAAGHKGAQEFWKGSTGGALVKGMLKIAKKSSEKSSDRSQAIQDLEKSGDIVKMARGTDFARPQAEKDMISARMKEIKSERNVGKTETTDAKTLGKLDSLAIGLEQDKKASEVRPISTAISSTIFGAGGLAHIAEERLTGSSNTLSALAANISNIGTDAPHQNLFGNNTLGDLSQKHMATPNDTIAKKVGQDLEATNTQLNSARITQNAAQEAAQNIGRKNEIDAKEKSGETLTSAETQERIDILQTPFFRDAAEMKDLRERQETETNPEVKAAGLKRMHEIMSSPSYIESSAKDGGLENAKSTYHSASSQVENLTKKSTSLQNISAAMSASKEVFDKGMAKAPAIKESYDKMLVGKFVGKTASENRSLKAMQKDYQDLAKSAPKSLEKKHQDFTKQYSPFASKDF